MAETVVVIVVAGVVGVLDHVVLTVLLLLLSSFCFSSLLLLSASGWYCGFSFSIISATPVDKLVVVIVLPGVLGVLNSVVLTALFQLLLWFL